jgi:hypothetical protein
MTAVVFEVGGLVWVVGVISVVVSEFGVFWMLIS